MRLKCFVVLLLCVAAAAQDRPCSEGHVTYEKPAKDVKHRMSLGRSRVKVLPPGAVKTESVQGTHWMAMRSPDYTRQGPWSTTIYFGSSDSDRPTWQMTVVEHGNNLRVEWVTEKLLHLSIWWGRMSSSEVILDMEKREIMYHEVADYSELVKCEEKLALSN